MATAAFRGHKAFLSNFYDAPIVDDRGWRFATVEHAYQALKTIREEDFEKIRTAPEPADAKRLVKGMKINPHWHAIKDGVMYTLLEMKFSQHPVLAQKLMDTYPDELVEVNWWGDTYWGRCNGEGENKLGKLLMELRHKLRLHAAEKTK